MSWFFVADAVQQVALPDGTVGLRYFRNGQEIAYPWEQIAETQELELLREQLGLALDRSIELRADRARWRRAFWMASVLAAVWCSIAIWGWCLWLAK